MRRLLLPLLIGIIVSPTGLAAAENEDQAPRFRVNVDTVVLRVTVTDPLNRYVVGLEREHFRVFEN